MPTAVQDTPTVPRFELRHRLALALEFSGVTVAVMSAELGVHRNTVSRYMNDPKARVTRGTLRVWADVTGVPLEWLTGTLPDMDGVTLGYAGLLDDLALAA